jgi:hypothetical protein
MTLDEAAIARALEPVFIYYATPEHPEVHLLLTVTPDQGDAEAVYMGAGQPKRDVIAAASAGMVVKALSEAVAEMLPKKASAGEFELLVWHGGDAPPWHGGDAAPTRLASRYKLERPS